MLHGRERTSKLTATAVPPRRRGLRCITRPLRELSKRWVYGPDVRARAGPTAGLQRGAGALPALRVGLQGAGRACGDGAARPGRRAGWTAAGPGPGLPRRVCSGLGLATGTAFRAATFLWGEERGLSPGDPLGRQLGTVCLRPGGLHVEVVNKR